MSVSVSPSLVRYCIATSRSNPDAMTVWAAVTFPAAYQSCPVVSLTSARPGNTTAIRNAPTPADNTT